MRCFEADRFIKIIEAVDKLTADTVRRFGRIDILALTLKKATARFGRQCGFHIRTPSAIYPTGK